ncbi:MAG: sugar phosphate isomerase/epimerase [Planctomycetota bacterium]|nr:sugar phosphate isomerase/epimerase [Planctomycetota bacterium]
MTDVVRDVGVQSWCFRRFKDNATVISKIRECGVSKVELAGVHADFKDEKKVAPVAELYRKEGIEIVSIGVQGMANKETDETKFFECLKVIGARFMSVDFDINAVPEAFKVAERLAEKYDVRLAIHNHGGRHWLGSAQALTHVFSRTGPRIGLCLDTAWALDAGEDPLKMIEKFRDRLYGLHLKDFVFDTARKPRDVVVGEGNLKLRDILVKLKETGFAGYVVLEYEADPDNPVPALKKCVQAFRNVQ